MLRVLLAVCLSLPLSACSMGHVSLPMTLPSTTTAPKTAASPPADDWREKRRLGGSDALAAAQPSHETATTATTAMTAAPHGLQVSGAVDLINELRRSRGLAPLAVSAELTQAAQMQAANLARTGTLTHVGPDGSTPLDRVHRAGYRPRMAAENIAGGQSTAVDAVRSWRESESHLRNLLLPDATQMGIAQVNDPRSALRTYWALVLAKPL